MNPTDTSALSTSPLPGPIAHLPYVRVLTWPDQDEEMLHVYLAGPDFDDSPDNLYWLTQGSDMVSIPGDAMEQFVAGVIKAGVELGQR